MGISNEVIEKLRGHEANVLASHILQSFELFLCDLILLRWTALYTSEVNEMDQDVFH